MIYGAILETGENYYTDLKKVFAAIKEKQNDYNWLITGFEGYPNNFEIENLLNSDYCFITGEELTKIIEKENFQWIWGVLSGFKKDIELEEILKYPLPYADGYGGFWSNPLSLQNKLADIEIVAWDASLTLLLSKNKEIVDTFLSFFKESQELSNYNKEMSTINKIKGIEKVVDILGSNLSFHDASVSYIKYNGKDMVVTIDCKGFLKILNLDYEKLKDLENIVVSFKFKNVSLFESDGGYGDILELDIDMEDDSFIFEILSCGLKIKCKEIEVDNVKCIYKDKGNKYKNLDNFLKSNL